MSNIQAQITGTLLEAKTASFKDDSGNDTTYGKVQVLVPDMSGEFYALQNIKVARDNFGLLPDLQSFKGKQVTIPLDIQTFQGKTSYYLAGKPINKAA